VANFTEDFRNVRLEIIGFGGLLTRVRLSARDIDGEDGVFIGDRSRFLDDWWETLPGEVNTKGLEAPEEVFEELSSTGGNIDERDLQEYNKLTKFS